jgi:hypothetical protein
LRAVTALLLGPLAVLRLRAEVLLELSASQIVPLTEAEREELDRIAVVPQGDDEAWLGRFDAYLADCRT